MCPHQVLVANMMSKMRLYFRLLIMRASAGSHNAPLEYSYVLHSPEASQSHKSEGCKSSFPPLKLAKGQNKILLPRPFRKQSLISKVSKPSKSPCKIKICSKSQKSFSSNLRFGWGETDWGTYQGTAADDIWIFGYLDVVRRVEAHI